MPDTQTTVDHKPAAAVPPAAPANAAKGPPKRVLIVVGLIAAAALAAGGRMWYRSHNFVETENAYVTGHVHPVSSRIPGVVTKVLFEDNQVIKAGDVLAELDPADQGVKVEQIQAQIASVQQQIVQADAAIQQARAQASAAQAQVVQAQANLVRARQDAERYGQLYNTQMKAVSKAEVDAATAARAGATADVTARRDNASAAQAQIAAATSAREVLKAQVKVLEAQLKDAQQQLGYNRIVSPVSGRIGKRSVEVGARVQPGQQLAAIVQDDVWVVANFKETQLPGIVPGQQVSIEVDALPKHELVGRVDSFAPASGNQFALLPADNATGNFTKIVQRVPVKITFAPEDLKKYAGRLVPGMSTVVEIDLRQKSAAK
ncbi:HlyD family efflux transporter periplasmic adaptor subunit [Massilia sp. NEAU-DD11]|uniref:HlyD family efflux transporter periplasmic adaptor subunit n=1 Tax=Massilia cellulosiltytica TaxID=2683234 RepID=A0A7X3FZM7_9BURK|nr:HlyD family secretion protein [Telluria cellulosilytica]MVW60969.1 HlyD family efflux transporter periplasmic adaptor subunit [Telluria cellulosilytica]